MVNRDVVIVVSCVDRFCLQLLWESVICTVICNRSDVGQASLCEALASQKHPKPLAARDQTQKSNERHALLLVSLDISQVALSPSGRSTRRPRRTETPLDCLSGAILTRPSGNHSGV